jgi:hypothetical protein
LNPGKSGSEVCVLSISNLSWCFVLAC